MTWSPTGSAVCPHCAISCAKICRSTRLTPNSGSVATTAARQLVFGAGTTSGAFSAAGTNFTNRIITTPDLDIAEDRFVTATGSYNATAPVTGSSAWVMQVATFRAANQVTA